MCKSKAAVLAVPPRHRSNFKSSSAASPSGGVSNGSDNRRRRRLPPTSTSSGNSSATKPSSSSDASASASSSALSLVSLRGALHEAPAIYPFPELCAVTKNFLAKRLPGASSSAWRCTLRGRDAVVIQRPLRRRSRDLPSRLADLGRSHHGSLARLLGASTSGDNVYLVYEFVPGASLANCLRNPRNSGFTPLASWVSRVQVAADVAQGLEYIHCHSSAVAGVHNRVKSSAIIVTQPDLRAKICHFGAADLAAARPDMTWVAGKVSKLYLESTVWAERVSVPTDLSVSIAPR